jgi:hypothetical protein
MGRKRFRAEKGTQFSGKTVVLLLVVGVQRDTDCLSLDIRRAQQDSGAVGQAARQGPGCRY